MNTSLLLLVLLALASRVIAAPPRDTSKYPCLGKGFKNETTGNCMCINGFFGFNCQKMYCPHDVSWNSKPLVSHTRNTERVSCSNAGECDHSTGKCKCRPGYEGRACERIGCPTRPMVTLMQNLDSFDVTSMQNVPVTVGVGGDTFDTAPFTKLQQKGVLASRGTIPGLDSPCSGHGICRTIREAAATFNGYSLVRPPIYYDSWEADKIQGCLCDKGWDGFDCSFRKCPWGVDPQDPLLHAGKYHKDKFTIECQANAGYFAIDVLGGVTAPIPYDADPTYIKRVLEAVTGVGSVEIVMQEDVNGIPQVCGETAALSTSIVLIDHPAQLPPLRINTLLDDSRFRPDSSDTLMLNANSASISLVTIYELFCGNCGGGDCHGQVHFAYGDSMSDSVDIRTTGAKAAIEAAIGGMSDLITAGWAMPSLDIDVSMDFDSNDKICQGTNNTVIIKLHSAFGNIPGLKLIDGSYRESAIYVEKGFGNATQGLQWTSTVGNAPLSECSNQGECDRATGKCHCFDKRKAGSDGYFSVHKTAPSNGLGQAGYLPDCGYIVQNHGCGYSVNSTTNDICSGNGICRDNKCICESGFHGIECNLRSCPSGPAWFDEPTNIHRAHADKECSGQGWCDHEKGECICREGWGGASCGIHDCPADERTGEYCSGHGFCRSISEIFGLYGLEYGTKHRPRSLNHPEAWDGGMFHECVCAAKYSAGEFSHPKYSPADPKDWVGRYDVGARPLPGWTGWACQDRLCPRGDARMTHNSLQYAVVSKEVQRVICTLSSGSWTLSFFGQTSLSIAYDANAADIKQAIEHMNTVGNVTVTIEHSSATACNAAQVSGGGNPLAGIGVKLQWDTEGGNLPLSTITSSTGSSVSIETVQDGTSENLECGGPSLGLCDRDTGICECTEDRYSSDGGGGLGANGDCGYRPDRSKLNRIDPISGRSY